MKQLYPDLWQTTLEKRYGTLQSHAYFLAHDDGNALIYHSENSADLDVVVELGGAAYQYLSHNHEITPGLWPTRDRIGAKLCGHANMQPYFGELPGLDVAFDTKSSVVHAGGFEVIFTPGHTDNNLCYLYSSLHGKTYLFTGDTIYQDRGTWNTLIMQSDGGDRDDLRQSLVDLGQRHVDVIITSVSIGPTQIVEVTQPQWRAIVAKLISDLD